MQRAVNLHCLHSLVTYGFAAQRSRRITPEDVADLDETDFFPIAAAISYEEEGETHVVCVIEKPRGDGIMVFDCPLEVYEAAPTVEHLERFQ